jgi:hypothetical protein
MKFIGAVAIIVASGFFWPCEAENPSPEMTNRLPTATEVFHLRSECAALGRKILDNNVVGSALSQSQISHYDPKSNRCYVELTVQTADLTKPQDVFRRYLFDGQTDDMLAVTRIEKGERSGMVFDRHHDIITDANARYDDTTAYIDALMDEGHR